MKKSDLYVRQRQSGVAIILILLKFVRFFIRQFWPLVLVLFLNPKAGRELWILAIVFGIAGISLAGSVIEYFRFYYWIENGHLRIEKGLLRRTKLNLPFTRIQTIDFEQNLVHQAFGVVRVKVDSAGSGGEEIAFDALQKDRADVLREYILRQKAALQPASTYKLIPDQETRELLLQLGIRDLLKVGISQNHLRTAGIIFAFFLALAEDVSEALDNIDLFGRIGTEVQTLAQSSILFVLIAVPVFLSISFTVSLVGTVIVHYHLRFWKTHNGFKLDAGLFTRREKSAQKDKIQLITWVTNPVRKLFGMFKLNLYQASSVDVLGDKSISVPGCYHEQVDRTIASVIPGAAGAIYEEHGIHPTARTRFILFAGLLPCVALSVTGFLLDRQMLAIAVWAHLPVAVWMGHLYYRKKCLALHTDYALLKGGIFGDDYKLLEIYKIQAVSLRQSFYQWRRDLATVTMYTASGDVSIPFIPVKKAEQIRDYLLYRIEVDERAWM